MDPSPPLTFGAKTIFVDQWFDRITGCSEDVFRRLRTEDPSRFLFAERHPPAHSAAAASSSASSASSSSTVAASTASPSSTSSTSSTSSSAASASPSSPSPSHANDDVLPFQQPPCVLEIRHKGTGRPWIAGDFQLRTLAQLMRGAMSPSTWAATYGSSTSALSGTAAAAAASSAILEVVTRKDAASSRYVDVAYLQSLPQYRGATFQVASNFNAIEAVSEQAYPTTPYFVTTYYLDKTQGPAASISAGAAAIARVYMAFHDRKKPLKQCEDLTALAQTEKRQLNFMGESQELREHFPVQNGYVVLTGKEKAFPPKPAEVPFTTENLTPWDRLLASACVGVHLGVQVTSGSQGPGFTKYTVDVVDNPDQLIDQVFCAGLNISQGASGYQNRIQKDSEDRARFCLDVAYQGAYLTAVARKSKHLVLTMIGAGVFGNKTEWVLEAITRAHRRWAGPESSLKTVSLVVYAQRDNANSILEPLHQAGLRVNWVHYVAGVPETKELWRSGCVIS